MPRDYWFAILIAVIFVVSLLYNLRRWNQHACSPRWIRSRQKQSLIIQALMSCVFVPLLIIQRQYWFAAFFMFMVGTLLIQTLRRQTPKQELINYAVDPKRCGRCEYDLTGNTTGICSECGWVIPDPAIPCEKPDWAIWWKRWDIAYLENWRKSLWMMIGTFLLFSGTWLGMSWWSGRLGVFTIPLLIMALHFAVNIWRVVSYGRACRAGTLPASQADASRQQGGQDARPPNRGMQN